MASTSKRVARKDTNSIRSHQHLCVVMLLSGCLAVCGCIFVQMLVRYRFFASSGLSLDCLFGMCNAVIQTAPMHSASVPSLALLSWGNEMGLVGVPRFSDAVACGGQRLTRAEYPLIKALKNTNRQMLRWMIDLNSSTSRVGLDLETQMAYRQIMLAVLKPAPSRLSFFGRWGTSFSRSQKSTVPRAEIQDIRVAKGFGSSTIIIAVLGTWQMELYLCVGYSMMNTSPSMRRSMSNHWPVLWCLNSKTFCIMGTTRSQGFL